MLDRSDPFYSSKYLIRRAKKHTDEFKTLFAGFIEPYPYVRVVDQDADTGEDVYKIKLNKPMPEDLPGLGFDAVNNLRAALDSAIFTITKSKIGAHIGFPIRKTPASFEKGLKEYLIDKNIPPELVNIIRGFKAYKGGNHLLWALKELRDANNHSVIIPATTFINGLSVSEITTTSVKLNILRWDDVKDEVIYGRRPHGSKDKPNVEFTAIVSFTDIDGIGFQEAVVTLDEFVSTVEEIVEKIEIAARRLRII